MELWALTASVLCVGMDINPQTGQTALPSYTDQAKSLTGEHVQPQKEEDKQVTHLT